MAGHARPVGLVARHVLAEERTGYMLRDDRLTIMRERQRCCRTCGEDILGDNHFGLRHRLGPLLLNLLGPFLESLHKLR